MDIDTTDFKYIIRGNALYDFNIDEIESNPQYSIQEFNGKPYLIEEGTAWERSHRIVRESDDLDNLLSEKRKAELDHAIQSNTQMIEYHLEYIDELNQKIKNLVDKNKKYQRKLNDGDYLSDGGELRDMTGYSLDTYYKPDEKNGS